MKRAETSEPFRSAVVHGTQKATMNRLLLFNAIFRWIRAVLEHETIHQ